jgi:flagellar biosynthesis protein FlhF
MEVRSYYATTVEAAMQMARKELGRDAMLIQSQRTSPETAHLGQYEVVFAGELQVRAAPPPRQQARVTAAATAIRTPVEDYPELEPIDLVSGKSDFARILESAGVDRESSGIFFDGAPKILGGNAAPEIASEIACSPGLGRTGFSQATVALIGPPGVGKTTTIMKLAIQHGLAVSQRIRVIAVDPHHICSTAQLSQFAELLHIGFAEFDSFERASQNLYNPFPGLTLMDTPGYSRSESAQIADLASFLKSHHEIDTHLVIRADRKPSDNLHSIDRFAKCAARRLILTALDETEEHAGLRSILERAAIPISFLGIGPRIPEDLEAARAQRISGLIAEGWKSAARAAA